MARLFGTDGVRGTANTELTADLALALGRAAGAVLAGKTPGATIIIGRDTRASGEMLEAALAAGLCSAGVHVVSAGVLTTPAVAMLTRTGGYAGGAVISASHNPPAENGIKLLGEDGTKLADALERRIESMVGEPARTTSVGRYRQDTSLAGDYERSAIDACQQDLSGIRLVVDGANGAGSVINTDVLERLGINVHRINCEPDGANINADCGSTHPTAMQVAVRGIGAELGAAFDGDGDRVILCDGDGAIVDGDYVMAIFGTQWVNTPELPQNTIVGTVMSNLGLEECLAAAGVTLLRAAVGDKYVAEMMRESGAAVGGEKSGHIILARHATTGDGLLTLLQVLCLLRKSGKSLAELASVMKEFPQILVGVRVGRKDGWDKSREVQAALQDGEERLKGRGRLFVRPSGTENVIRVMAEGPDHDEVHAIVHSVAEAIRRHAGE